MSISTPQRDRDQRQSIPDTNLQVLRDVTAAAAGIFADGSGRTAAAAYLRQRGIDASQLHSGWMIGYAPPGWTRLVRHLQAAFPEQALLDAGVARLSSRGSLIDTFRDRVVFGIRNTDGSIAGFIGRDLSGQQGAPKYLNTRQHRLFDKGGLLYGLHEGSSTTAARQPVIVEGPLDVLAIAACQHIDHRLELLPVAPCGTAFTDTHARLVADAARRTESPAVVAMDGDAAGRTAAVKIGERLRTHGVDVRVAILPNGADPADYLVRGAGNLEAFHADHGLPLINLHVENAIAAQGDRMQWIEGRLSALRSVSDHFASYPAAVTARHAGWVAQALNLDPSTVTFELAEGYRRAGATPSVSRAASPAPATISI